MDPATLAVWSDALNVPNMAAMDSAAVASTFAAAADGVMLRLRKHVVADQGHLDEQMDRASGAQISAKDLTWSYAEALNIIDKLHATNKITLDTFQIAPTGGYGDAVRLIITGTMYGLDKNEL